MAIFVQGLIGLLFGLGLVLAGMANPAKVLNFLDIAGIGHGQWDPSLAFVMGGAVIVASIGFRLVRRRTRPLMDDRFHLPESKTIDSRILIGPAIFGLGWGLSGFCPGPAFVAIGTAVPAALAFGLFMLAGIFAAKRMVG